MINQKILGSAISLTVLFAHVDADKVTRSIHSRESRELAEALFVGDHGGGYGYTRRESSKSSSKGGKGGRCESSRSKRKSSGYYGPPGHDSTICQVFEFLKENHSQQPMCQNFDVEGYCELIDHLDPKFNALVCPCEYETIEGYDNKVDLVCPYDDYEEIRSKNRFGNFCSKALGFHYREPEDYRDLLAPLGTDIPTTPRPEDDDDCFLGCKEYVKYCCCKDFEPEPTPEPQCDICVPPIGGCIDSFEGLKDATENAQSNDVIAVCGGSMNSMEELTIPDTAEDVTLCCAGTDECKLTAQGAPHRILRALGGSFTLCGMGLEWGDAGDAAADTGSGGNLLVTGGGDHRVINSRLSGGRASLGANLAVLGGNSMLLDRSLLQKGVAVAVSPDLAAGGGAFVSGVPTVRFIESCFTDNRATREGAVSVGGGFAVDVNGTENVTIDSCTLERNEASLGGGFTCGVVDFFTITDSTLNFNHANIVAGSGLIDVTSGSDITINGNVGMGNTVSNPVPDPSCADIVLFNLTDSTTDCIPVDGVYPPP